MLGQSPWPEVGARVSEASDFAREEEELLMEVVRDTGGEAPVSATKSGGTGGRQGDTSTEQPTPAWPPSDIPSISRVKRVTRLHQLALSCCPSQSCREFHQEHLAQLVPCLGTQ